jgi:hypothetical protein
MVGPGRRGAGLTVIPGAYLADHPSNGKRDRFVDEQQPADEKRLLRLAAHTLTSRPCQRSPAGRSGGHHESSDLPGLRARQRNPRRRRPRHGPGFATGPRPGRPCRRSAKLFANSLFRAVAEIPRPNIAGSQTSGTATQFDYRLPHIATRGKPGNFVLVKPWRCADDGCIVHPAKETTLRRSRCPSLAAVLMPSRGVRRKSLCFSASCREIMHRSTRRGGRPWFACRRVSPSTTFLTSCSWLAEETYQPSLAPSSWGLVGPDSRTLPHDPTSTAILSHRHHCRCIVKSVGSPASPG